MSYTLEAILTQAIDNYPVTATLSPEIVAVLFFALSRIEHPYSWLDRSQDPLDEITTADADEIDELVAGANLAIITPEVGFIRPYITTTLPSNCIACDGGTYDRVDYPLLYAVIDSIFVIDADTFTTPDFRGRFIVGVGSLGGDDYSIGDTGGLSQVALTEAELAAHSHTIPSIVSVPTQEGVGISRNITVPLISDFTGVTGGDAPHENRPPFGAVKYCIVAR